jgi:hypothetical protein
VRHYLREPGDPWRGERTTSADKSDQRMRGASMR